MLSATHIALVYGSVLMMVLVYMTRTTAVLAIVMMLVLDVMVSRLNVITFANYYSFAVVSMTPFSFHSVQFIGFPQLMKNSYCNLLA